MWLGRPIDSLYRVFRPTSGGIVSVGAVFLTALMLLVFTDVLMRYVFNNPIMGSFDLVEAFTGIVGGFGLAYCALQKGHITIDLVISRFPPRIQGVINLITGVITFGVVALATWQTFVQARISYLSGTTSVQLHIPYWIMLAVVGLGFGVMALVMVIHLLEFTSEAVKK